MTNETLEIWAAKGHFSDWDRYLERRTALYQEIALECRGIEPGGALTTTELVRKMHPDVSLKAKNYWCNGAQFLRKRGYVKEFFRHGRPNGRTFGHPAVLWVNPDHPPENVTLEDLLK